MARSFTTDDVKQLIASYNNYEHEIAVLQNANIVNMTEINRTAYAIMNSNVFSENVVSDLRREVIKYPRTFDSIALISALHDYVYSEPYIQECRELQSQYRSQIKQNISVLQVAASSLRWIFTNGKSKAEATAAFSELSELQKSLFSTTVEQAKESIKKYTFASADDKIADFVNDPTEYRSALLQCADFDINAEKVPSAIKELIDSHQTILGRYRDTLQACNYNAELAKTEVKASVDKMLTVLLMKELRGYDVDALNQKRGGLRIKALKDAGYSTVEDVYCATASNLASVYGISPDNAEQIKETAREIATNLQKVIKLRLSTDERTDESNALIGALYSHQKYQRMLSEAKERFSAPERQVRHFMTVLSALKNNLCWLFATESERESYIQSYQQLSEILAGSYPGDVYSFQSQVSENRQYLADEAWDNYALANEAWYDFAQNSIAYFNALEELVPGVLGNGDTLYGLPEDLAREIQDQTFFPQGLKVTLRRYQEWGVKYILHQEKALLGDEMGLGKTVQAIATMVSLRNTGATHFLVICPASVLPNWCKEIDKKSEFRSTKIHGSNRQAAFDDWIRTGGVAVTTYETTNILSLPDNFKYNLLVVDEAHYIKNEGARRSISVRAFGEKAERILFMTGTALENKVDEMISLIQVLQPDVAARIKDIAFMSAAPQFREQIAPVYYRRKREDVLSELPEITETKQWCDLFPEEENEYECAVLRKNRAAIRKVSWVSPDLTKSSKARRMREIIDAAQEDGRKVLIFSFYLDTIRKIRDYLGTRCTQPIDGSVPIERRQEIIDEFDTMPAGSVLLAQIQAGGTGLNIQSASVVIICEPQLKPSIEKQAISRAYRMGQTRKVLVYKLLASNTIDERIDEMLEEKQMIFDAFADKSVAAQATKQEEKSIDDKTIGKLIREEIDRINAKNGVIASKPSEFATEAVDEEENNQTAAFDAMVSFHRDVQQETVEIDASVTEEHGKDAYEDEAPVQRSDIKDEQSTMVFSSIDSLIEYLEANGLNFKDNRSQNGCLWIKADAIQAPERILVEGKRLRHSKQSKALNGAPGWYIS